MGNAMSVGTGISRYCQPVQVMYGPYSDLVAPDESVTVNAVHSPLPLPYTHAPNASGWPSILIGFGGMAYAARVAVDWVKSYDSFSPAPVCPFGTGVTDPLPRAVPNVQ